MLQPAVSTAITLAAPISVRHAYLVTTLFGFSERDRLDGPRTPTPRQIPPPLSVAQGSTRGGGDHGHIEGDLCNLRTRGEHVYTVLSRP